jgi:type IV pilus assembly protein PilF
MRLEEFRFRKVFQTLQFALVVVMCSVALYGCAVNPAGGAMKADLATGSDESESTRRAKIRLELAVGYYSNGQTTIALDELKKSIGADSGLFEAYNLRGLIYMRLNDAVLAEESFKRALLISPSASNVQHNYGLLLCQQSRMTDALQQFNGALSSPNYTDAAKTLRTLAGCQFGMGQLAEAEASYVKSYELDAVNPITTFNLAALLFKRGAFTKAQILLRRLNNSDLANAESLWLGIQIERKLGQTDAMQQLGAQLTKRFPQSRETSKFERGVFNE